MSERTVSIVAGDGVVPRPRARGGRGLSALLPGVPQVLAGRWGSGGTAALVWLGLLWTLGARRDRVGAALGGPWDAKVAVATLLVGLVGSWAWSWMDNGMILACPTTTWRR